MVLSLFAGLKGLLKARAICTDGPIFRLHSRWTVLFLLCSSVLLTCRQYFGDPIHCLVKEFRHPAVFENFCWIHSTFILPSAWNATVGVRVPYPGIDTHVPGQQKTYHGYYQWVALVLLLQAVFFYLPRYVWKAWEKGTMKAFTLNLHTPLLPKAVSEESIALLTHALHLHWGHFGSYLRKYIFCEVLALVNVVVQMWLLDHFLGGTFTTFGVKVIQWTEWDQEFRKDPLVSVFPRVTKCQFHDFGSAGSVQRIDAMCILPLNILNEKIFVFLWFWMVALLVLTGIVLLYRLLLSAMPMLRYCVLVTRAPTTNKGALEKLINKANMSDWFVLYLLSKNLDSSHYKVVVSKLVVTMEQNGYVPKPSTSEGGHSRLAYV